MALDGRELLMADLAEVLGPAVEAAVASVEGLLGVVAVELDHHDAAAGALDQRAHRRSVHGALGEVALPVAGNDARGHLGRSQADVGHARQANFAGGATGARQPRQVALVQQAQKVRAQGAGRHRVERLKTGLEAMTGPLGLALSSAWIDIRSAGAMGAWRIPISATPDRPGGGALQT